MKVIKYFSVISVILVVVGCTTAPKLSPLQKREITTRIIDGSYDNTYRSILVVLQDQGYIIKNTDMNTGLINAIADRETGGGSQFMQSLFSGYVSNKGSELDCSFMVSKISDGKTDVRINIQESKYGQSSKGGSSGKQSVKTIYDVEIYSSLFNEILTEVKRREAINMSAEDETEDVKTNEADAVPVEE